MAQLSDTQIKILKMLSDGQRHKRTELMKLLPSGSTDYRALSAQITRLREKLKPHGQDIICEYNQRAIHYRHIRLIGRG